MKFFFLIMIMVFSVTDLFARESSCNAANPIETLGLKSITASSESMNCFATKNKFQCQKIEDDLDTSEKYKVLKCDSKSLEANRLGNASLADCVWNGLKISGDSLVDIAKLPGVIAEQIAKGFNETQFCNSSVEKKREILQAFNLTVEDSRFKIDDNRLGLFLNDASCSEIERLVFNRYQNYQNTIMRERIAAINSGKKPAQLKAVDNSSGPGLTEMLKSAMASMEGSYQCYTPKVKAEMICAGVTSLLADAALGGGVAMAVKRMSAVVKSARAVTKIRNATSSGQAVDLADAAVLLNRDRVKAASAVLSRKVALNDIEKNAIIASHEVGLKEGRGFYEYTAEDIAKKTRLLRDAGFDKSETRALMEAGITGAFRDNAFYRSAMIDYMNKSLKIATTALQQESLISIHEMGLNTSKNFLENAKDVLKNAKFSDEQIAKILKSKGDNEKGLLPSFSKQESDAAIAKKAAEAKRVSETVKLQMAPTADSTGRKAVLANFKDDEIIKFKHTEIPVNLSGEALVAKQSQRRREAQEFLTKMEKKNHFDVQSEILENGTSVQKARKMIKETEEQMAKLPEKGSDLRRKELQDKLDRSKTSEEMYQKKCKAVLELYREAHGYPQYMKQYEKDYANGCM